MARRVIGLDVGTNAVRVAELELGDTVTLRAFGQVALPLEAMREGEVIEPSEVTAAIQRLFKELGLKRGEVRVGIAGPRVIVRPVDMPAMSEGDLASALRFQAQELIPIPLDEAVLDFQVLEGAAGAAGPPPTDTTHELTAPHEPVPQALNRVLLAAAHRETVDRLVGAVRAAGLKISAIDLVPLALIRSLGRRVVADGEGAEAIVSVGGGVTVVVVHDAGLPRFVRMLGTGGRALTDAIARELEVSAETAEALKRQGDQASSELLPQVRSALERPLADLVEEVRGSIDYYRTQPDASRLLNVVLTGGASQQEGLADGLARILALPISRAAPREHISVGDIGFPPEELESIDPYLAVPVGLALGGAAAGKRINLLGGERAGARVDARPLIALGVGILAAVAVVLGFLTIQKQHAVSSARDKVVAQKQANAALQTKISDSALAGAVSRVQQVDALAGQVQGLLVSDVSWPKVLAEISRDMPSDVWLTSFQASGAKGATGGGVPGTTPTPSTSAPPTSTTTGAGGSSTSTSSTSVPGGGVAGAGGAGGNVTFQAEGLDYTSVAAWLQKMAEDLSLTTLWVPNAARSQFGGRDVVTFSATASLTAKAQSSRAAQFAKAQP